jgi:tyrosine-protein phosphatase non-receptor type 4
MEIPRTGIVNRYIAAQGPLPHTTGDFWQCVWEQSCTTVVMLTTTVERGRVKCHQYWPRKHETLTFDELELTCVNEKETASTAYREMCLVHVQVSVNDELRVGEWVCRHANVA